MRTSRRRPRAAPCRAPLAIALLIGIAACRDAPPTAPAPEPPPAPRLATDTMSVALGHVSQLRVLGARGPIIWRSADERIATVSPTGAVRAVSPGRTTITASVNGQQASAQVRTGTDTTIGPDGGDVCALVCRTLIHIPAGALDSTTEVTVFPAFAPPDDPRLLAGSAVDVEPSGLVLHASAELALLFDSSAVPAGLEDGATLAQVVGGAWEPVTGSAENGAVPLVFASTTHFGTFGILLPARMPPSPMTGATIAAGDGFTCAIATDHSLHCWGYNEWGQLAVEGIDSSAVPVASAGDLKFTSVTAGDDFACGITASGDSYCWGLDQYGQLGNGTTVPFPHGVPSPVRVATDVRFVALTAGMFHACGLDAEGRAYCWGQNRLGQLGVGTLADSVVVAPRLVALDARFASISAGGEHTCGITRNGVSYCWGENTNGQLGLGVTSVDEDVHPSPERVIGAPAFQSIDAGGNGTCAVGQNVRVYCWGAVTLGRGELHSASGTPMPVIAAVHLTQARGGRVSFCALDLSETPYCWGLFAEELPVPTALPNAPTLAELAMGAGHACGLGHDGRAYCWGVDAFGNLGTGEFHVRTLQPLPVTGDLVFALP
ncbi:MAG TPA: Ig-like domain-containing protein [Gemmatimonadaceae bacterium]|nr:Ig-like domain-containing protein [Gemmatimonadaceae bacterium]